MDPLQPAEATSEITIPSEFEQTCSLFEPELAGMSTAADIGAYVKEWHGRINSSDRIKNDGGVDLLAYNTALVDAALRRIFGLAIERSESQRSQPVSGDPEIVIIATGGYGRRELSPFSDIDVTFVPSREDDDYLNAIIKDMFQTMMDAFLYGANLKVGYSYRLIGDLNQLDHQTQTTLLDARYLCGDESLFRDFRAAFRSHLLTAHFIFEKWAERKAVVNKQCGDIVYTVEPNVKEGAGGLRDIQTAEWIAEVRFKVRLPRAWAALTEDGAITAIEAEAVAEARDFLHRVRNAVHVVSREARDILTAEKQEAVAALLAYPGTDDVPAVETFMREFYQRCAMARRISRKAVKHCLNSEIPMGLGLVSRGRTLFISDPITADQDSVFPLHAAELSQVYGLKISPALDADISSFLERHPAPTDGVVAGRVFSRLLATGRRVADTLDWLEDNGCLAWLIPEFRGLVDLIPYDAAHDYTVGYHSLLVVRKLENLKTETDPKLGDYRRVADDITMPEVLYLASLIHDVGKQYPESGHAELGARVAVDIADRLGWEIERKEKLIFLVRHHLLMAETSRLRDLSLEETIREFIRHVPDLESLNMLYLLTYADTNSVGDGVWTEVKGKFLTELYYRSEAILSDGESDREAPSAPNLQRQRERIRKQLALRNLPIDIIHEHTRNLPAQYLLNTPLEEMYLHIAMIGRLRETFQPIVDFRHEYGSEYTEMTICAYDDPTPGLLAKISGVLYAHDLNLHTAQVFTRDASVRIAIDTLWTDFRGRPLSPSKRADVQQSLRDVLTNKVELADLLAQKRKVIKDQTIYSARIDDQASERFSLLEVSAPDDKGVVYRLASTISKLGWNIHAARLSVWGSRARDAFYITGPEGRKVPAADVERLVAKLPTATFARKKLVSSSRV